MSITPKAIVAAEGIALPDCSAPVFTESQVQDWHNLAAQPAHLVDASRLGYIVFTSGSGGTPKAVAHAHRAILARASMWEGWYGLRSDDRLMHAGAFNWTYTLGTGLMDPWSIGATALIPAAGTSPSDLPSLLHRAEASLFAAAPGVYRQMLRQEFPPLPMLRHGLSAGEKLPETTRNAWRAATGTEIHEALGMSECSTFISGSPIRPAPEGTTGYAQEGRRVTILDHDTLAIHRDDPGLMLGYLQDGVLQLPLEGDWFDTGDQIEQRDDGAIQYVGRADDMMNAGGYRLSPLEIEDALRSCPDIGDIAVCEVRPDRDKSLIAAFYTGSTEEPALKAYATTCLAGYKQPHLWIRLERLPTTLTGKVNRKALRKSTDWRKALR